MIKQIKINLIGSSGKKVNYTAKVSNGEFIELVRHQKKKDKTLSYDYGKRIYDHRGDFYLSLGRGQIAELPPQVSRYETEPPVYQKPRTTPKHKKGSDITKANRATREAILKVIQDIRSCSYRLAQYVFKTVLRPLGENVDNNPSVPLDPIHLVLQFTNSTLYIVYEAPDYWVGDEQITTGYLTVNPEYFVYGDVILETCGWGDLQDYMESLHIQTLEGTTVIGLVGKIEK